MSFTAIRSPEEVEAISAGICEHIELAAQRLGRSRCRGRLALDGREEADLAEVDREDRHAPAGEPAQGGEDRAVAAHHHRQVGRRVGVGAQHGAAQLGEAVLLHLLGRHVHLDTGLAAAARPAGAAAPAVAAGLRRVKTVIVSAAFTAPPFARPPRGPPPPPLGPPRPPR